MPHPWFRMGLGVAFSDFKLSTFERHDLQLLYLLPSFTSSTSFATRTNSPHPRILQPGQVPAGPYLCAEVTS